MIGFAFSEAPSGVSLGIWARVDQEASWEARGPGSPFPTLENPEHQR